MKNIKLILFASLLTIVIVPFGILFNIYNSLRLFVVGSLDVEYRIEKGLINFYSYWKIVFVQTWYAINYILFHIAKGLDYVWNATAGELFEEVLCTEEKTLYGKGEVTVSCATGKEESRFKLTSIGGKFTKLLNAFFHQKNHCLTAWEEYNIKTQFKK